MQDARRHTPYGFGGLEASSITVGAVLYSSVNGSSRIASELWNSGRCTPLAAAIACGSVEAAALLLRQPGVRTLESSAVCRAAVAAVRTEQVRILLDRGSDPNERDAPERSRLCEGVFNVRAIVTPLEMALRGGRRETAALLRERGAN